MRPEELEKRDALINEIKNIPKDELQRRIVTTGTFEPTYGQSDFQRATLYYFFDAIALGKGEIDVYDKDKLLRWYSFYPLNGYPVQQQGIGTLTTITSVLKVMELKSSINADYAIVHSGAITDKRRLLLEHAGISDPSYPMLLPEYLGKLMQYGQQRWTGFSFQNPFPNRR